MRLDSSNLAYPAKVICDNGSTGSGFFIQFGMQFYLVTAKHVVFPPDSSKPSTKKIKILGYRLFGDNVQRDPTTYEVDIENLLSAGNIKFNNTADIVLLKLGYNENSILILEDGITMPTSTAGNIIFYDMNLAKRFDDVLISNEVFVLGYPTSIGEISEEAVPQIEYDMPLLRKGIVSGKNYTKKTLVLDCPVYGGNSGGMVLEINNTQVSLIGIVIEYVPFVEAWINARNPNIVNQNIQNSGYSIALPVDYIFDLIEVIEDTLGTKIGELQK